MGGRVLAWVWCWVYIVKRKEDESLRWVFAVSGSLCVYGKR